MMHVPTLHYNELVFIYIYIFINLWDVLSFTGDIFVLLWIGDDHMIFEYLFTVFVQH